MTVGTNDGEPDHRAIRVLLVDDHDLFPDGPRIATAPSQQLTDRELDVLRLIARGMENSEIAATSNIRPCTAKKHASNILAKLELPGRVQAAAYAVRRGLG